MGMSHLGFKGRVRCGLERAVPRLPGWGLLITKILLKGERTLTKQGRASMLAAPARRAKHEAKLRLGQCFRDVL